MLDKRASERVAHQQPVVEEGQRQPLGVGLDPERELGQFNRQRILVYPVQTVNGSQTATDRLGNAPRNTLARTLGSAAGQITLQSIIGVGQVAHAGAQLLGAGLQSGAFRRISTSQRSGLSGGGQFITAPTRLVEPGTQEAARLNQEMTAAHRRVKHAQAEQRSGLWVVLGTALITLRPEGFLHQKAHKAVGRVEGAGSLAAQTNPQVEATGRDLLDPFDLCRFQVSGARCQIVFIRVRFKVFGVRGQVLSFAFSDLISPFSILPTSDACDSSGVRSDSFAYVSLPAISRCVSNSISEPFAIER